MKQQILDRARSTVEAFLRAQYADTTLAVLAVDPEVDGDGDEFLWISLKFDDGIAAPRLPDSLALIRLKARLRSELESVDVEAFPVVEFVAESEIDDVPE